MPQDACKVDKNKPQDAYKTQTLVPRKLPTSETQSNKCKPSTRTDFPQHCSEEQEKEEEEEGGKDYLHYPPVYLPTEPWSTPHVVRRDDTNAAACPSSLSSSLFW